MDRVYILVIVAGGLTMLLCFTMRWERLFGGKPKDEGKDDKDAASVPIT
jgi:hypothetical protein